MTKTRDKILKTLRRVPGVIELNSDPSVTVFQRKYADGGVGVGCYTETGNLVIQSCETKRNATLAEAVAALTPLSEPRKPTYDFVAEIRSPRGPRTGNTNVVLFTKPSGLALRFRFNPDGSIKSVHLNDQQLATPETEPEVLATLKMCRVEVGG